MEINCKDYLQVSVNWCHWLQQVLSNTKIVITCSDDPLIIDCNNLHLEDNGEDLTFTQLSNHYDGESSFQILLEDDNMKYGTIAITKDIIHMETNIHNAPLLNRNNGVCLSNIDHEDTIALRKFLENEYYPLRHGPIT